MRDLRLAGRIQRGRQHNVLDQTGCGPGDVAIYTLSDPRDIEAVRYVGQTRNPVSRFSQHLNTARLWLPDELPWWVKREQWRPLYTWIRQLYREDGRLPLMVIVAWTIAELANSDERRFVSAFVAEKLPLLNVCLNPLE
jgi:hypothetical protein